MVRAEVVSVVLGYTSIACWLGAQLPQIIVNWRRKSVDGLALPFLINWFFGDATNLIGCLLTGQLPFQTYLATYFVFVDVCLVSQYFYYDAAKDARSISALRSQSRTSLILPPSLSYSPHTYTLPHASLTRPRSRSYSMDPHLRAAVANVTLATTELEARHTDPHTSEVDAQHQHARFRSLGSQGAGSLERLPESVVADPHDRAWAQRQERRESDAGDGTVDLESESTPSMMVNSFYSEGGGRGRGRDKHVSWSTDSERSVRRLSNDPPRLEPSNATPSTVRGRQLTRSSMYDSPSAVETSPLPFARKRATSTASNVSAAASRRGAGIVFLSVFALFGLSTRVGYEMRRDVGVRGEVLTTPPTHIPLGVESSVDPSSVSALAPVSVTFAPSEQLPAPHDGETRRLIGRISAWTCTTLYLTSRLPQIWKNFVRKSVEGLSMYLFTFAFLGNFFYVLSILTSPNMDLPAAQAAQFLRASIPYLLGSGGTLIFDVTIVLQSFVYAQPTPSHPRRRRKSGSLVGAVAEEERALLETNMAD